MKVATILYGQKRISDDTHEKQTTDRYNQVLKHLSFDNERMNELRSAFEAIPSVSVKDLEIESMHALVAYERSVLKLVGEKMTLEEKKYDLDISTQNVIHDINTLLEGMSGSVDYIRDHHAAGNADLTRSVEIFKSNMLRFKILATKFGSSLGEHDFRRNSLSLLIGEAANFYQPKAAQRGVTIKNETHCPDITMSREHLQHCFYNLVENAVKYSYNGHRSPRYIELASTVHDDYLEVNITNFGIGFDLDEAQKIFQPRYQSRRRKNEKRDGSGLGLAIANDIVDIHYGCIWAESREMDGHAFLTTFHVLLPLKHAQSATIESIRRDRRAG